MALRNASASCLLKSLRSDLLMHTVAYQLAGLSYPTKFNLRELELLPYTSDWFASPSTAPTGSYDDLMRCTPVFSVKDIAVNELTR